MLREIPLDETIHKVLLNELKLIFPKCFSYESSTIMSKQIVASIETEIVSQSNIPLLQRFWPASKDSSPNEQFRGGVLRQSYENLFRSEKEVENKCCDHKVQN